MAENISHVIITLKIISHVLSATPYPKKEKAGGISAGLSCLPPAIEATGIYMPEPWIPFQLASIAFTAFSGSGT